MVLMTAWHKNRDSMRTAAVIPRKYIDMHDIIVLDY